MAKKKKKSRPRDPNELAKAIVDIATEQEEDEISEEKKEPKSERGGQAVRRVDEPELCVFRQRNAQRLLA